MGISKRMQNACAPLQGANVMKAIRTAVVQATGQKEADLDFQLQQCVIAADGATEAMVIVPVRKSNVVHTFRVASDARGRTVSVRHEGTHVATTAAPASSTKKAEITKKVWIGIGVAVAAAVVIIIAVVIAKKAKQIKEAGCKLQQTVVAAVQ